MARIVSADIVGCLKPPLRALYKARAASNKRVGKLKRFKRIALRCEKTLVNEFKWLVVLLCIRSHPRGIVFHSLGDKRKRHIYSLEEAWIVSWSIAVVLIDNDGFFGGFGLLVQHIVDCRARRRRGRLRRTTDGNANPQWGCPRDSVDLSHRHICFGRRRWLLPGRLRLRWRRHRRRNFGPLSGTPGRCPVVGRWNRAFEFQ
jgi:hypothetical protein